MRRAQRVARSNRQSAIVDAFVFDEDYYGLTMSQPNPDLIRHFLATLAYRSRKTIVGAPADFGTYAGAGKSPSAILSHMGDLLAWAISWFSEQRWAPANGPDWDQN